MRNHHAQGVVTWRVVLFALVVGTLCPTAALAQQSEIEQLRSELATLKKEMARIEALLRQIESRSTPEGANAPSPSAPAATPSVAAQAAPAMNTPPALPESQPAAYIKMAPRFDVLMQVRADAYHDAAKIGTFRLRKAEVGIKGHIARGADYSIEIDPVRPSDPFRRTYIRLMPHNRVHIKLGLEKAPLGLDELTSTAQLPFVDRSEVNDRFSAAEELGIHVESRWSRWMWQLSVTNGGRRLLTDDNENKAVTGRVVWAPQPWLSLGLASMQGQAGTERRDRDRYNVEAKLGSNLSGLQAEFYRASDGDVRSSAFYTAAFWAFATERAWLTHVQPVFRYEHIDRSDRSRGDELRPFTSGVSVLFHEHQSKLQFNYLWDVHTKGRKNELRAQYQVEF